MMTIVNYHNKNNKNPNNTKTFSLSFSCASLLFLLRFRKGAFEKNYKATIGVDFEMERFEVLGVPYSLQL